MRNRFRVDFGFFLLVREGNDDRGKPETLVSLLVENESI